MKILIAVIAGAIALCAETPKGPDAVAIPPEQMTALQTLNLRNEVIKAQAAAMKAESEKLQLEYEIWQRDLFEILKVSRTDYTLDLSTKRLIRREQRQEPAKK
jgi:hypothetical protein